jgi:hypothetical protein
MKPWCCDRCKAYHQRVVNKEYETRKSGNHSWLGSDNGLSFCDTNSKHGCNMTNKDIENDTASATYTVLNFGRKTVKSVQVSDHCIVDLDDDGYPVGVETI